MKVYDPYTQKEITIDTKMLAIQSKALAAEKGITVKQAEAEILSSGGMTVNIDMYYADVIDAQGKYVREY